jgi:hypothetical protein
MIRAPLVALLLLPLSPLFAAASDLILPVSSLTPGVSTELTEEEICSRKWGKDARHVTAAMKKTVFKIYGMKGNTCKSDRHGRRCEIDHLISRELGGADAIKNLWPQPYGTSPWNATRKDKLENRLHQEVCAGRLPLKDAQEALVSDYRIAYVRYFGEPK